MPESRRVRRRSAIKQTLEDVVGRVSEFLRGDGIAEPNVEAYLERLRRDWIGLVPWLPSVSTCHAFLDIGCGLGGHAAMLSAHYPKALPYLLDGKENRPKGPDDGGFRPQGEPWVNVYRATRLVSACCGVDSRIWSYPEVLTLSMHAYNLVVSFRAWGHHFPVSVYLPLIEQSLAPGGRIILDVRTGTDGLEQLVSSGRFTLLGEIEQQSTKCRRLVLEKATSQEEKTWQRKQN